MSPEANNPTPEQQDEKPYVLKARELAEAVAAKAEQDTEGRFQAVDTYVADILNAADAGEVGDYTKSDLLKQFNTFKSLVGKSEEERNGIDPFMLIPRANGLRDAFRLLEADAQTSMDLRLSLELNVRGNETVATERVSEPSPEMITSEIVREKMGGVSLDAMGIDEPLPEAGAAEGEAHKLSKEEYLSTLADGLSTEDLEILESYAKNKAAQNRTTSVGEYDNATYWGREAHKDLKRLSNAVTKELADRYAHARNYY